MSKKLIRALITEYKEGRYKGLTLKQAYNLLCIKQKQLTVKESESVLKNVP